MIIIPSDTPQLVLNLLESIKENDPEHLEDVIVVTGSGDAMEPVVADYGASLMIRPPTFNFAAAVNTALKVRNIDEHAVILNDDTALLTVGGLSAMLSLLDKGGHKLGVISAGIKGVAGTLSQQAGNGDAVRLDPDGIVSFVAVGISNSCLTETGYLDERYTAYGWEDIDYCTRAHQAGFEVGVYDGCIFSHYEPSTSFKKVMDVRYGKLKGELIYHQIHTPIRTGPVFVVGTSNSGASVVAAMLHQLGVEMADPHPDHIGSTSMYYRDAELSNLINMGEDGALLYGHRRSRDLGEDYERWGSRLWPNPQSFQVLLNTYPDALIIFVKRSAEATKRSYAFNRKRTAEEAGMRIDIEQADLDTCVEMAEGMDYLVLDFWKLATGRRWAAAEAIARYIGFEMGLEAACEVVNTRLVHYHDDGQWVSWGEPQDFGKIAVGVRCSNPHPSFVACYAALTHEGMREGDVLLNPQYRVPSHLAANELMRDFLATDADTLLLIDDDMTFDSQLLERMRTNPNNFDFHVVSALATQRLVPPRAIVFREGKQPPLPDSLDGLYYRLVVEGVEPGKTMMVGATGFAFTLIRRSVLEAMTNEYGPRHTWYVQWGQNGMGEDVHFCREAGSLGYSIGVDCDAQVGHIGSVVYGYDEFDRWRKSEAKAGAGISLRNLQQILGMSIRHLPADLAAAAADLLAKTRGK